MPNHRPLSNARITAKKRETHWGFLIFGQQFFDADVPISVIAQRRAAVAQNIASNTGKSSLTDLSKAGWSWGCVSAMDSQGRLATLPWLISFSLAKTVGEFWIANSSSFGNLVPPFTVE